MEIYNLILYFIFGILPSLIWLFYYLAKDLHPEPKKMILRVFLFGMVVTVPLFFVQVGLAGILKELQVFGVLAANSLPVKLLLWFGVIAFTEELAKYLVVKFTVFKSGELDEPLDIMLYMVVSALGFAAIENILYLFSPISAVVPFAVVAGRTITVAFIRFIGATFLHTLCSALLGYFLALSFLRGKKGPSLALLGIGLAALLHGLYDFSIITLPYPLNTLIPVMVVAGLGVFMIYDFNGIKKIKSICKI